MRTVEERLAHLEARVAEHANTFTEIRESLRHLEQRLDTGFERVDRRFESMEAQFDTRFAAVDGRLDALDQRMSRQSFWIVGMQMTTLIAVVGALLARL